MLEKVDILEQRIADRSFDLLKILLTDKTTGGYIKWCTDNYLAYGDEFSPESEMNPYHVIGKFATVIQPRVSKTKEEQLRRTRDKAEVFTPTWIVNQQNNLIDEAWFGKKNVFNTPYENTWRTRKEKIVFPKEKNWKQYVDSKRLEISCGEAPYLVNRYDPVSGKILKVKSRVGLLDRKIRIVNENVENEVEWENWIKRAYQSTYGFELQGDSVLIARENLLYTYCDNKLEKFGKMPTLVEQKKIANIIAWNIWQMDGITLSVPYSKKVPEYTQLSVFDFIDEEQEHLETDLHQSIPCRIFDWRSNESIEFKSTMKGD